MKTYTKKNLITKLIISAVVALVLMIVLYATGTWNFNGESVLYALLMIPISVIVFPFSIYSVFFVNWGKALKGLIAPIPILSYIIEFVKGFIPAALSIVALCRGKETFIYGKADNE